MHDVYYKKKVKKFGRFKSLHKAVLAVQKHCDKTGDNERDFRYERVRDEGKRRCER